MTRCGFFELSCHAQNAAQGVAFQIQSAVYEWWVSVGWINKALIFFGLFFLALYLTRGIGSLVGRIGGWRAVIGYVAVIFAVVLWAFLKFQPKKPADADDFTGEVDGADARRSPRFRVPPPRKPKKPRPKRRFNPDTARWEEL